MKKTDAGGIGFLGILTLIFITLKLTGYIAWSWVWVVAPLWIPLVLIFSIALLASALAVSIQAIEDYKRKNQK